MRRRDKLDDLLVWAEETPEGTPTGRYVLLDGAHRLAAYRAAWRMVWDYGFGLSKERLAGAANIGVFTVGEMRRRWRQMLEAGAEPSFSWRQDRQDPEAGGGAPEVDQERRAAIAAATADLRRLLLRRPRPSMDFLTEVAIDLFGTNDVHFIADFILGGTPEDEFDPETPETRRPEVGTKGDF